MRRVIVKAQASTDTHNAVLFYSKPDDRGDSEFFLQIVEDPALHARVLEAGGFKSYWFANVDDGTVKILEPAPEQPW